MNVIVDVEFADCSQDSWLNVTVNGGYYPAEITDNHLSIPVDPIEGWNQVTVQTNKPVDGCYIVGAQVTNNGKPIDTEVALAPGGANLTISKFYEKPSPVEPEEPSESIPWTDLEPAIEKPAPVTQWVDGEPVVDCDDLTVTTANIEQSAGYYWGENDWVLGDFFPTGDVQENVQDATVEECPVGEDEPVQEPTEDPPSNEAEETAKPVSGDPKSDDPAKTVIITEGVTAAQEDPVSLREVEPDVQSAGIPITGVSETQESGLAETGGDFTGIILGAAALVAAGAMLVKKSVRKA